MEWILPSIVFIIGAAVSSDIPNVLDWVARSILLRAVRRLPKDQQQRYLEEWSAHINDIPVRIIRVGHALSFVLAARKMKAPSKIAAGVGLASGSSTANAISEPTSPLDDSGVETGDQERDNKMSEALARSVRRTFLKFARALAGSPKKTPSEAADVQIEPDLEVPLVVPAEDFEHRPDMIIHAKTGEVLIYDPLLNAFRARSDGPFAKLRKSAN